MVCSVRFRRQFLIPYTIDFCVASSGPSRMVIALTTPCETTPDFERDLIAAARAGGFNVLRLVKEPVAAVMAYGLG